MEYFWRGWGGIKSSNSGKENRQVYGWCTTQKLMWKHVFKHLQESAHFMPIHTVVNDLHY